MNGKLKMKVDEIDVQKIKVKTVVSLGSFCVE
jgi:predicted transport protein